MTEVESESLVMAEAIWAEMQAARLDRWLIQTTGQSDVEAIISQDAASPSGVKGQP